MYYDRAVNFRVEGELLRLLDKYAQRALVSRGEIIRDAIVFYLNEYNSVFDDEEREYLGRLLQYA